MQDGPPLQALLLTMTTLVLGVFGAALGFVFGLSVPLPLASGTAACLWLLGWTAIGSLQGACAAPAFHLGRGAQLGLCRLIISVGSALTSLLALALWQALGRGAGAALALSSGLCAMCAVPLCAYLFGRREIGPGIPL